MREIVRIVGGEAGDPDSLIDDEPRAPSREQRGRGGTAAGVCMKETQSFSQLHDPGDHFPVSTRWGPGQQLPEAPFHLLFFNPHSSCVQTVKFSPRTHFTP